MNDSDSKLIESIKSGHSIERGDAVISAGYKSALMHLMSIFVDSELAGAAGFADLINSAPGLKQRLTAARMVSEKLHHGKNILDLMQDFGIDPTLYVSAYSWSARLTRNIDLGTRKTSTDKRLNVFHYPIEGWVDALCMNLLMSTATYLQLEELCSCSYQPLAQAMKEIVATETRHARAGENGLSDLLALHDDHLSVHTAICYWLPRVAASFGRADSNRVKQYRRYGLRRSDNAQLLAKWQEEIVRCFNRLHLKVPEQWHSQFKLAD